MKKRSLLSLLAIAFIASTMVLTTSCGEEDTEAPVITFNEPDNNYTVFGTAYTDPGATAVDNDDKNPTVTAAGEIDENYAGEQTITYTATDKDGNSSTKDRIVTVDAAPYLEGSNYTVTDPSWTTYTDDIDASGSTYNKIIFNKYADFQDAVVYGTCEGLNITIPEQIIQNTGTDGITRKFSGSGTFTAGKVLTITYTVTLEDGSDPVTGTATYTPS